MCNDDEKCRLCRSQHLNTFDDGPGDARPDNTAAIAALKAGDLAGVCKQAINVFESATALAGVRDIRRRMEACHPLCSQMTGSGSCVFAIFEDEKSADACREALEKDYPNTFVCVPCAGIDIPFA